MTIGRSTMAQASMLVVTRTARVCIATQWKASGPACAILRYAFTLAEPIARGQLRPLRNPQDPYAADGWFPALDEEFA
jgi:hypothetical protein